MAQLQIPISDELLAETKAKAALAKVTLRQFVIKLLTRATSAKGGK